MHDHLTEIITLLAAAVIDVTLFHRFRLGAIIAYLCAGIFIGPEALGLISNPETILSISELGVILLLFLIGLELKPARLWQLRYKIFGLGLMQMVMTGLLLTAAGYYFELTLRQALIAGFGLALSSTAFAMQLLKERKQANTLHGQGSFAILLFQDLAVVPLLALVTFLQQESGKPPTEIGGIITTVMSLVGFVLVGLYTVPYLLRFVAQSRVQEVFIATSLLIVVGSAFFMEKVGLSAGTGAFLAGVILANSEYRHELEANLLPFKGLFLGLFFIAIGMGLDLGVIVDRPGALIILVVAFLTAKIVILWVLARMFGFPQEAARNIAFTLPQGGEFAFVIFTAALSASILTADLHALLSAAVTLSMILTPVLFNLNQKVQPMLSPKVAAEYDAIPAQNSDVIVAGYGRFGQIVTRFLRTQGISFTILEHSAAQVDIARKFGAKIYYGDASKKTIVEAAGAAQAKIFVLAIDDVEASTETAKMVKQHYPHLHIIARVRNRSHALDLLEMGLEHIHRETYLTSLEVAKDVLLELGHKRPEINKKLAVFRQHDEAVLREQIQYRHDEKDLISFTNKSYAQLEEILKADLPQQQVTPVQGRSKPS